MNLLSLKCFIFITIDNKIDKVVILFIAEYDDNHF